MNPERYRRACELLARAFELPPADRPEYIRAECGDDAELFLEASSLLSYASEGETDNPASRFARSPIADTEEALNGSRVGRFQVIDELGRGGMGIVWRAHDPVLDRPVAIKFLPPALAKSPVARERFLSEARAASALDHANVATIYDFGESEGKSFIALRLVQGETVAQHRAQGPLAPETALRVAIDVAHALAHAHERGVLHRDVSASNVMITPQGRGVLLDFGLAASAGAARGSARRGGTPNYIAPEVAAGAVPNERSDIFALGVVLYEMLTGRYPFEAQSVTNAPAQPSTPDIVQKTEPGELLPGFAPILEKVVRRAIATDPGDRPASASAFAEELEAVLSEPAPHAHPYHRSKTFLWMTAGAVAVAAVVALGAYLNAPSRLYSADPAGRTFRRITYSGTALYPVWSPDGKHIAYSDHGKLRIIPADGGPAQTLDYGAQEDGGPWGWTPDSKAVITHAYWPDETQLAVIEVGLDDSRAKVLVSDAKFGDVSHSGKYLAYELRSQHSIWIMTLATGEKRLLVQRNGEGTAAYKPKWSPDDHQLSYIRWNGNGHEVWVVSADGTKDRQIPTGPMQLGGQYCWFNDGRSLLIAGEMYGSWSTWKLSTTGKEHVRLTINAEEEMHVSLAPDQQRFVLQHAQEVSRVAVVNIEDGSLSYPFELDIAAKHPTYSADGKRVLFQVLVGTRWQTWESPLDGAWAPRPVIALGDMSAFAPSSDPQGNVIHLRGEIGRVWRFGRIGWSQTLWRSTADGGRYARIAAAGDRVERVPPSPVRGNMILFSSDTPGGNESICVLGEDAEPVRLFTNTEEQWSSAFDWGSGDREILVAHNRGGSQRVDVVSAINIDSKHISPVFELALADTGNRDLRTGSIAAMALSPDRQSLALLIALIRDDAWVRELHTYGVATGQLQRICGFDSMALPNTVSWSPDSRHVAVELYRERTDIYISEPAPDTRGREPVSNHPASAGR